MGTLGFTQTTKAVDSGGAIEVRTTLAKRYAAQADNSRDVLAKFYGAGTSPLGAVCAGI